MQCDERISKDRHRSDGEECAVVVVLGGKSAIWRRMIVKTFLRKKQMIYIDVDTNDKQIAEQIKSDSKLSAKECLS